MLAHLGRALLLAALLAAPALGAETVRIGVANPLSGPFAASGERTRAAVQLAVDRINGTGGVLGRRVELVAADDRCGTEEAVSAAQELVAAGVVFVVGHRCSHASLMAAPVYEAAGIPMMSPDSTHPLLTDEGRANVFRLIGRDDGQGRAAGDWLAARRPRVPVGIVHDDSTYGRGLAAYTRDRLRRSGVREALFAVYQPGAEDYGPLLEEVRRAGIGVLYVGGYGPDAGRIVKAARARGSDLQVVGGDGLEMDEFWTEAGEAGNGTIFTARPDPRREPGAEEVLRAFRASGLMPNPTGLGAYAAVQVWAQAAARAGTVASEPVMESLHRGRFDTVLGRVGFDAKGDLAGGGAWQWQIWRDGSFGPLAAADITN
jgi:branched-chain amino acid transport system substrate-binding protein